MAYIGAGISRFNTADELTVTGTSEFGGNVSFGDNNITNVGSLQIDSIAGDADTNTNITFAGSDVITMTTAGSERLRITSAGSVGIGTSSPDQTLVVKTADGGGIAIENAAGNQYRWAVNSDDSFAVIDSGTAERLRIDSSGNLLVGKTSASVTTVGAELRPDGAIIGVRDGDLVALLNRTSSDGEIISLRKDNSVVGSIGTINGDVFLGTSNTSVRFQDGSNAIIPVTSAGADRDNATDLGTSAQRFKDLYLSGTAYVDTAVEIHAGNPLKLQNVAGNGFATIQNAGAGTNTDLSFNTAGSEAMRIDSSGNVGIGTSSPSERVTIGANSSDGALSGTSNTQGLHLYARNFGIAQIDSLANGSSNSGMSLRTYNNGTYTPFIQNLQGNTTTFATAGSERMRITSGGSLLINRSTLNLTASTALDIDADEYTYCIVMTANATNGAFVRFLADGGSTMGSIDHTASATRYLTTSDYRLKENVSYDFDATTRLKQLRPARFNFIADADTTVDGFLAHEVQSVVSEAISGTHNEVDADGNPVYQGIDQAKLVPLLVKTIQELEARITALEAE
jgi:hypothetical protein